MKRQTEIIPLNFSRGERFKVAPGCGGFFSPAWDSEYGTVECEAKARPAWFYVRDPRGLLDLVPIAAMERA